MEGTHLRMICLTTLVGVGLGGAAVRSAAQSEAGDSASRSWKEGLEYMTRGGSHWRTSNADYRQEGEPEAYGIRFEIARGGLAARGCLWGETDGEVVDVYWDFFMGWDPVNERGILYQSHPSGLIGIGEETLHDGPVTESVQTFVDLEGASSRLKHRLVKVDADTHRTESFNEKDGEWVPRRTYTWLRRTDGPTGC